MDKGSSHVTPVPGPVLVLEGLTLQCQWAHHRSQASERGGRESKQVHPTIILRNGLPQTLRVPLGGTSMFKLLSACEKRNWFLAERDVGLSEKQFQARFTVTCYLFNGALCISV
jgi:hypothetical protein